MKAKYIDDILNEGVILHTALAIGGLWCIYGILKEILKMQLMKMIKNYSDPNYVANKQAEITKNN